MSTFALAKAVHVCRGNLEFDFAAGQATAKDFHEETALDHLVELDLATVVNRTPPPVPEPEAEPVEAGPPDPPPPAAEPPGPDAADIAPVHEEA